MRSFIFLLSLNLCPLSTDMGAKSSAYLYETLSDPLSAFSNEPNQAAFNKGFNTNKTLWEFYEDPAQSARLYRFNIGMQGLQRMQPIEQLRDCTSSFILIDSGLIFFAKHSIGIVFGTMHWLWTSAEGSVLHLSR